MASPHYTPPQLHDITIPDLFSLIAQQNPHRDLVQIIREHSAAPTDSTRVTWATFIQHAQNAAADIRVRWAQSVKHAVDIQPRMPGAPLVVVGMLGASGYEYYVNLFACSLNRWTVLLISPKNSPAAIEHLLRTAKSSLLLVDSSALSLGRILEDTISDMFTVPFAALRAHENCHGAVPLMPEQVKLELDLPAFYLHTSGSTGHPKIIPWSHRFFLSGCRARQRDGPKHIGRPLYSIPPLCHAMGMMAFGMFIPAHANLIIFVSSPTPKPPSAASLVSHIPFIKDAIVTLPPSILEDLDNMGPEAVKTVVEGTSTVIFAGASLKKETGDALTAAGLKITMAYGSTEVNVATKMYVQRPENWEYVEFREGYDWQFLPVDDDPELRELVVAPGEDCPAVINHEFPRGYATNDVWAPHPSIPNLWKYHSRKGDVTVLSNGEKTDNKQIEGLLLDDKRILYVQVFGAGRPLNGVIVQPASFSQSSEFLTQIQPTIDHANTILPKHSRLVPEFVIVASPDKPFATTDKGTVKTKDTLDKYADEIERRYAALEGGDDGGAWELIGGMVSNEEDVRRFVRMAVKGILSHDVPDEGDLFEYGLDSLLALRLRAAVISVVKHTATASQPVARNIVYTYPTINALSNFLLSRASSGQSNRTNASHEPILQAIARFSSNFEVHKPGTKCVEGVVVAITGSTGSLGCSLLSLLLKRKDISKVYLLNRKGAVTQQARQAAGLRERGFDPDILEERKNVLAYLDIDLSRKDLGLASQEYEEVRDNVTHIIHVAWRLNFNLILESYERVHVAGVRHLIDLALSSPQRQAPRIVFLSSIASVGAYRGSSHSATHGGPVVVPEEAIDDPSIPSKQGYGQSKYVSERVLVNAVAAGLQATIVRVGQLSGTTTNGAWNRSEHIPILVRSSIALGIIPDDLPPVRWVPADVAAAAVLKQAFARAAALEYFHVENTVATPWRDVAAAVVRASRCPLRLVGLAAWLRRVAADGPDAEKVPAVRLLDFYYGLLARGESVPALGWQRSVEVAPELEVGPITAQLMEKYVRYQLGINWLRSGM